MQFKRECRISQQYSYFIPFDMLITITDVSWKHIDISLKPVLRRNESPKQTRFEVDFHFFLAVWYLNKCYESDDKVSPKTTLNFIYRRVRT